jgi:hypothetical protein
VSNEITKGKFMTKAKVKKYYSPHESYIQNGIYLLVFVIIALLFWPLAPKPNNYAVGVLLPQGQSYPTISPAQVTGMQSAPKNAALVGTINTKIYYASTTLASDQSNLDKSLVVMRKLASQNGANVLVVNQIGTSVLAGPLDGFFVQAKAYHN